MNDISIETLGDIEKSLGNNPWNSLILGNGASMALDSAFSYKSLYEYASTKGSHRNAITPIFQGLDTTNFEHVLRVLSDIKKLALHFGISESSIDTASAAVRNALIEAVNKKHIEPIELIKKSSEWNTSKDNIRAFVKKFRKIITFNYDLTLYWVLIDSSKIFKDGFSHGNFDPRSPSWPSSYNDAEQKLYFYPHGSLAIVRTPEQKLAKTSSENLRKVIDGAWANGRDPLFVSEGTATEKLATIRQSLYLNTVYNQVLTKLGSNVVAYGFSFAENDTHVLDAMATNPPSTLAVSVFSGQPDSEQQSFAHDVSSRVRKKLPNATLRFFHHDDPGVWIFP